MKIIIIAALCIFSASLTFAQNNIIAFFEYDIKDGMTDQFVNGYGKDLEWHASQDDDWSWVGWFIINGPRRGRFVDASPDHTWSDFDNWKVNAAENARHNKIHWAPYVENASGGYKKILDDYSHYDKDWYKKKYLQVYHLKISHESTFRSFLAEFRKETQLMPDHISFIWTKTISGGGASDYQLFVAMDKIAQLEMVENLFLFSDTKKKLSEVYAKAVVSNTSELWRFSEPLSWFTND